LGEIEQRFRAAHESRYGYVPADFTIEVVTVRVVVSAAPAPGTREEFAANRPIPGGNARLARGDLVVGDVIAGPRLVADAFSSLLVGDGWRAVVGSAGSMLMERTTNAANEVSSSLTAIDLELFTCRFTALVDDMGVLLQRCALSVNVKERLDFSCALLDADGKLVTNAPHIPVHLGALGLCGRRLRESIAMDRGDVVVTNHPAFGGSHLPDVTLVAPVHDEHGELLGYVANRAHHAEIGGMHPGSMSPDARSLVEEGVVIAPIHLVRAGVARWEAMRELLEAAPYPSRAVNENLADLHAQLAAIRLGAGALGVLARRHGSAQLREFMARLQARAAGAVAAALARLPGGRWEACDALDDGTIVQVKCTRADGAGARLRIDFAGSGKVHPGNLNATPAIVRSATLYVLRVLAGSALPLNEGLMRDVDLIVPPGLLAPEFPFDPAACPAVAGGNVETSQRIVDVLLSAFGLAACSQGTMNNVVLGTDRISYYETIGGGTGAGPGFAGCDAVHSHMTNTAITDPEVMERRLPLRVERFAVRWGSGGSGQYPGGAGIERRLRFLASFSLSMLTQRRRIGPPGLAQGTPGQPGVQWIERADGGRETLGACAQSMLNPGDVLVVQTPGGGGWGTRSASVSLHA
jgi:5-oxoprolinase (ATP-hydrolysing)